MAETCFESPQWFWLPNSKGRGKMAAEHGELWRAPTQRPYGTQLAEILCGSHRNKVEYPFKVKVEEAWCLQAARKGTERQLLRTAVKETCKEWLHVLTEPATLESKGLDQRFREQSDKWAQETQHLSSPTQRMAHPSYQAIMGMAQENKREVIRLLLLDLQLRRRAWFWALSYLAQTNPIRPKDAGKMDKMIEAWVKWGKAEGVI